MLACSVTRSLSRRCISSSTNDLLSALRQLDTAAICDADKLHLQSSHVNPIRNGGQYSDVQLVQGLQPINPGVTVAGIARTIKCTKRNDLLALLRGLVEAGDYHVLVVDTSSSTRAVAGELFATEAGQRGIQALIIDGPVRDTASLQSMSTRVYAASRTPYAATAQSPGQLSVSILCGGVRVEDGDVVMADDDGILVAPAATFDILLPLAQSIQAMETNVLQALETGQSLSALTNVSEHVAARRALQPSELEFRLDKK